MKIWILVASLLVVVGSVLLLGVAFAADWDINKLNTSKYQTEEYDIDEDFNSISVNTDTADLTLIRSDDGTCRVTCYEETKAAHTVTVIDGVLTVDIEDTRNWFDRISLFSFENSSITIYLPEDEYDLLTVDTSTGDVELRKELKFANIDVDTSTGDVKCYSSALENIKIELSTGDVTLEGISAQGVGISLTTGDVTLEHLECAEEINISVTTGRTRLCDVECKSFVSDGDTGNVVLYNVIAAETLLIERSTGDIIFDSCDAKEIQIETSTGDVEGALLTGKRFDVITDTGDTEIPESTDGGLCKITTDTGDIRIYIK